MLRNLRKSALLPLSFLCITFFFPTAVSATTLSQYREKVTRAYDSLEFIIYPEEDLSEAENLAAQREKIREIRAIIPATDSIKLPEGNFEVDNRWLYFGLEQYESANTSPAARAKIVNELLEKLAALEAKLIELERQTAGARTKDEDKRKLSEILKRAEYQKPEEKQESSIQKAIRDFFAWLRNIFPKPQIGESSEEKAQSSLKPVLQIVVFLAVFSVIGFLLYRFAPVLLKSFRKREKKEKETRVILGETVAADATSQNLFSEAETLAQNGDWRAAIRKGYIALLCELNDKKIIGLARHKTNRDYLRDLRRRENLYREMQGLTLNFERNWYGFGAPREEDWEDFRRQYKKAVNKSN